MIAWRRRALDQQLPAAAFPAGSGAPSLVYLWATMLVAAVAVLGLAIYDQRGVPPAVLDSQRDVVSKLAAGMNTSIRDTSERLDRVVDALRSKPPPDAELLSRILGDRQTWNGAAIVETASRRPLAAAGVALPFDLLPPALPAEGSIAVTTPDGPALVRSSALNESRTLLALQPLLMRNLRLNPDARQGIFMIMPDGQSILMQGVSAVGSTHLPVVFEVLSRSNSTRSRAIAVVEWPDQQLVVSAAPIGESGVTVASLIVADMGDGTSMARGFLLGFSLLAVAVPSFLLMRVTLVRPLRALLRLAKANACGAVPTNRQPLRVGEAYRIAQALAVTSGGVLPKMRRQPTAMQGAMASAVVALLWPAAAVATTLNMPAPSIPAQLVSDEESRAEAAGNALGTALDAGLQTVSRISREAGTADPARIAPVLRRELTDEHRLRGLYLVDPTGSVVSSAGRESLRAARPLPGEIGIQLESSTRRLPVVYAYRVGDKGFAIVGEFDVDYLLGMMRRVDGRARVVDSELRTVLDSEGFRAFQPLEGAMAREVAIGALPGGTVGKARTPDGRPALVAASGLVTPPSVAHLEWSVVVERNVAGLRLPEVIQQRWTLLVAGAVAGIVMLTLAWQFFIFVRPLRGLAAAADRISNGSFDLPVAPQRHDDIGAIAVCLEICRQVQHTGSARLGGAVRLRGSEEDFTAVLPRVAQHSHANRAAKS